MEAAGADGRTDGRSLDGGLEARGGVRASHRETPPSSLYVFAGAAGKATKKNRDSLL